MPTHPLPQLLRLVAATEESGAASVLAAWPDACVVEAPSR